MAKQKLNYRDELVQAANADAINLVSNHRTGAMMPFIPTLELCTRAWLAGHEAGKKARRKEKAGE